MSATYMAAAVVSVHFRGERDGILLRRFVDWAGNNNVRPCMAGGYTGGGGHHGLYTAEDARKVIYWLHGEGVTPVEGSKYT